MGGKRVRETFLLLPFSQAPSRVAYFETPYVLNPSNAFRPAKLEGWLCILSEAEFSSLNERIRNARTPWDQWEAYVRTPIILSSFSAFSRNFPGHSMCKHCQTPSLAPLPHYAGYSQMDKECSLDPVARTELILMRTAVSVKLDKWTEKTVKETL